MVLAGKGVAADAAVLRFQNPLAGFAATGGAVLGMLGLVVGSSKGFARVESSLMFPPKRPVCGCPAASDAVPGIPNKVQDAGEGAVGAVPIGFDGDLLGAWKRLLARAAGGLESVSPPNISLDRGFTGCALPKDSPTTFEATVDAGAPKSDPYLGPNDPE